MNKILSLEKVSKVYNKTKVLSEISFKLERNKTLGMLGPNGCGKTTTLGIILGLIKPTSGKVYVDNIQIDASRNNKTLSLMNFASPYIDFPKKLTVLQNLKIYARLYDIKNINERIDEISEYLQLLNLYNKSFGELSSGQKTRVSLAKALINKPRLLLLDEPTASLDPYIGEYVRKFIKNYKDYNKLSILLASHNMKEVERLCDAVIIIDKGRVIDYGKTYNLKERYKEKSLEKIFLKALCKKNEF